MEYLPEGSRRFSHPAAPRANSTMEPAARGQGFYGGYSRRSSPSGSSSGSAGSLSKRGPRGGRNSGNNQSVSPARIINGEDVRATLMIRNVPNKVNSKYFEKFLNETNAGDYDFSYLRTDFKNSCNVGYAFVNFTRLEYILTFLQYRVGKPWPDCPSRKICEVSYATIQGLECLITKFRNSAVMEETPSFAPRMWYARDATDIPADKRVGDQRPFPSADNMSKLMRSRANAETQGLFAPRGSNGHRAHQRSRRSQYDRGTPRAMQEDAMHANHFGPGRNQSNMAMMPVHHDLGPISHYYGGHDGFNGPVGNASYAWGGNGRY